LRISKVSVREAIRNSTRWGFWLAAIALIVSCTILPWSNYVGHPHWENVRWVPFYGTGVLDLIANTALFFPFGYFFPGALRSGSGVRRWALPLLTAGTISTAVELVQLYSHNRFPSTTDICTNVIGAALGLSIHSRSS
jgi:glycopeptide antibiotics resistance protein